MCIKIHTKSFRMLIIIYEQLTIGCIIEHWDWEWDSYNINNNWSGCYDIVTYHADKDESHGEWKEKARENTQRDTARNSKCLQTGRRHTWSRIINSHRLISINRPIHTYCTTYHNLACRQYCTCRIQYVSSDHRSQHSEVVCVLVLWEQPAQLLGTVDASRKPQVTHILTEVKHNTYM